MFRETYNPNLSIGKEGRNTAIESLKKGLQEENLDVSVRITRVNALVTLLRQKVQGEPDETEAKSDLVQAEALQRTLLGEAANQPSIEDKKQA